MVKIKKLLLKILALSLKLYIYAMMGLVIYAFFAVIYIIINGLTDLVIQI